MTGILDSLAASSLAGSTGLHTKFGIASYMAALKQPTGTGLWSGSSNSNSSNNSTNEFADWRNQRARSRSLNVVHSATAPATDGKQHHISSTYTISNPATTPDAMIISLQQQEAKSSSPSSSFNCKIQSRVQLSTSTASVVHADGSVWKNVIEIDGRLVSGTTSIYTNTVNQTKIVDVWLDGCVGEIATHYQFTIPAANYSVHGDTSSSNPIATSPMPGKIIQIVVKDGAEVKKGDPIAVLEAMKMEHVVYAPCSG